MPSFALRVLCPVLTALQLPATRTTVQAVVAAEVVVQMTTKGCLEAGEQPARKVHQEFEEHQAVRLHRVVASALDSEVMLHQDTGQQNKVALQRLLQEEVPMLAGVMDLSHQRWVGVPNVVARQHVCVYCIATEVAQLVEAMPS